MFLFLIFELIALVFTATERRKPKLFFINSSDFFISNIYSGYYKITSYLDLKEDNERLVKEITELKNNLPENFIVDDSLHSDTSKMRYFFLPAQVIKNTVDFENNFLTIDKGKKDGVRIDDGVICSDGIVGVVVNVSKNYSVVLSVLNTMSGVSVKLAKTGHWGNTKWDGKDYRYVILEGIPNHIKIMKGDTILTSSYSDIFPENIKVGTIDTFWRNEEDNFYNIKVLLSTDFKKIDNILIISNLKRKEQENLQNETLKHFE